MKRHLLILLLILSIGFFLRTYQIVERFEFAHDGDLYSWIVKDIVSDRHLRLIGQMTSAPGIFVGPLFYYLLIPFFLIAKMDPIGALIPTTIIGLATIFSYYFVLSKLFTKEVGLIAAFLYAVLISTVSSDRWVVPTVTTSLWTIWYLYALIMIVRGKFNVFPVLGILIGLIWHVHIALLPSLAAVPVAILLSKKKPEANQIIFFIIALFVTSLPFIIFEVRHNFGQITSFFNNFLAPRPDPSGFYKFQLVLSMINKNINSLFFSPQSFNLTNNIYFILLILLSPFLLIKKKIISSKELLTLYTWIIGIVIFFSVSSSPISEYYFSSINVIFLLIVSLYSFIIFKSSNLGKLITIFVLGVILLKNAYYWVTLDYYNKGYLEKKGVVAFIKKDSQEKGYPCLGISYIAAPGENVGFRYLFYLKNIHLISPSFDIPVYNIYLPEELSFGKQRIQKFGHIGVGLPEIIPSRDTIEKSCQSPDINLPQSLYGYVE